MEIQEKKLIPNKGGSGSTTYRLAIPTDWIRKMGLNKGDRDVKLTFIDNKITIEKKKQE